MSDDCSTKDKYKMFRNFMTNELGISRADIEGWTKEATALEVQRKLNQLNFGEMVSNAIQKITRESLHCSYGGSDSKKLREAVACKVAENLVLTLKKS